MGENLVYIFPSQTKMLNQDFDLSIDNLSLAFYDDNIRDIKIADVVSLKDTNDNFIELRYNVLLYLTIEIPVEKYHKVSDAFIFPCYNEWP